MPETTRRSILIAIPSLAALAACGTDGADTAAEDSGTPTRDAEPATWDPDGSTDEDGFPYGVQVGDVTADGALVSVHSAEATLSMVLVMGQGDDWVEVDRQEALPVTDGVLQLELTDLAADSAFSVTFYAPDGDRRARATRFRTALADGDQRVVTFGATSCLGGNEPWAILSRAAEEKLDFFGLLGDTVYADGSTSAEEFRRFWDAAMRIQGMRDLSASTSLIATWDDHEVDNNWSRDDDNIDERLANATDLFNDFMPHRQGGGDAGVWRKLSWGGTLDVFVLDCRSERVPAEGVYISRAQMDWLKQGLSESTARFKIIFNSVPITAYFEIFNVIEQDDRWEGFPEAREEIIGHINDAGVKGVLWIAGDFHLTAVSRLDAAGGIGENQHEVLVGPGGSFFNPAGLLVKEPPEHFLTFFAEWNYTRFTADPGTGVIKVEYVDNNGQILDEIDLSL
ncbi:MAG: alkaline phosphatase D family protein [Myxococcota bacterium]